MPGPPLSEVELLGPQHAVADFDCGRAELNDWLRRFALASQRGESARVYVIHRAQRVVGYHALATGAVARADAPSRVARGQADHPIPVILLARLGVDLSEQGRGLGALLLRDALLRVASAADVVGVRALLVHAKDDEARGFYEHFGFEASPVDPLQLMLLMKDLRGALE